MKNYRLCVTRVLVHRADLRHNALNPIVDGRPIDYVSASETRTPDTDAIGIDNGFAFDEGYRGLNVFLLVNGIN